MTIIYLIIIGAAAGFLATRMMKLETDIITTIVIGICGALIGGFLIRVILAVSGLLGGLVGAVLGVGFARGIGALNLRTVGAIFLSWIITLPAGAGLAIIFFFIFKGIFGT